MSKKVWNWIGKFFYWVYIVILVDLIVFKYPAYYIRMCFENWTPDSVMAGINSANFIPLRTIRLYIDNYASLNSFENLFGNILAFIPFGFLYPMCHNQKKVYQVLPISLILIGGIEIFQLLTSLGAFDVDDFLLNALGVSIGYVIYKLYTRFIRSHKRRSK